MQLRLNKYLQLIDCIQILSIKKMQPIIKENITEIEQLESRKKEVLNKYDNAKFGWFHIKTILVAGIGFFTVSFLLNLEGIKN